MPADRPTRDCTPNLRSYDQERETFDLTPPARFNPVLDIVERWAADDPDAVALLSLDGNADVAARHTAADLARESRRAARALLDLGVGKGDAVFVMLPRVPAWYAAMLGAIRVGAVPMPGPNLLTPKDIAYRIGGADAVAAIVDDQGAAKVDEVRDRLPSIRHTISWSPAGRSRDGWHDLDTLLDRAGDGEAPQDPTAADDPLLIYFTSGTVAQPKMVLHLNGSYGLGHVITARYWQDLREGDVHWTISDTGWAKAAWGKLFGQWHQRATVLQMDMGKPDADTIFRVLQDQQVTSFCAPPTLYRMLVQADIAGYDLSALRHCTSAGEPLNPEVIKVWSEGTGGLTVYDGYGQTETVNIVANYRTVPVRPGSMGRPTPGYVVDVLGEDGSELPPGEVGNVCVRAEPRPLGLFKEYHRDPEATAAAFRNGWYFTGDKARKDDDGYFWFEGRADDVITSAAYRIGPFEVESALVEHPAVAEAAVVGKDDPDRTQIVTAFVILAPGHEGTAALADQIQEFVKQQTAPYKYPRELYFVDELPKTVSGKIRRTELRDWLREGRLG